MVKQSRCRRARPVPRRRARPAPVDARRVLSAFLKLRWEGGKPMGKVFSASHLERMLRSGQLEDAYYYLRCFLHRVPFKDSPLSCKLLYHVGLFKTLATVAAGGKEGAELAALYQNTGDDTINRPSAARLHNVIAKMNADPIRASKLWQEIQPVQLERILDLVYRCLELQGDVQLPRKKSLLWDPAKHRLPTRQGGNGSEHPMENLERDSEKREVVQV